MKKQAEIITFSIFIIGLFISCDNPKVIPFELTEGGRIVVKADVNGTSGRFFWDTGMSISQVNCRFDNLIFIHKGDFSYQGTAAEELEFYILPKITIGDVRLKTRSEITRVQKSLQTRTLTPEGLDGVLGVNIFEGYWCEVSFSEKKIILHKEKPIEFEKLAPVTLENNFFRISIDVDGKPVRFLVDTGFSGGMTFPSTVIQGKLKDEYVKVLLPKTTREYYLVKTHKISVFDDVFEDKIIDTGSVGFVTVSSDRKRGLLGIEYLKNYDLLFDFTRLRLLSTSGLYYKAINRQEDRNKTLTWEKIPEGGIYTYYRVPEGIMLGIIEGSILNAEYGITEKTIITKIDGKPAREMSNKELWNPELLVKTKEISVLEDGQERVIALNLNKIKEAK